MDNLQLVAIFKLNGLPVCPWDNLQIQFNSDAVRLHTQILDQGSEREAIRKFALFAIDLEFHDWTSTFWFSALSLMDDIS